MPGNLLDTLRGGLVVSCQADPGSPMRDPFIIGRLALAAVAGGARGVRIQGFGNVEAVRAVTDVPIIGLTKTDRDDTDVYITPTAAEAVELVRRGAQVVALDATRRPRPEPLAQMFTAIHAAGALVMADISTLDEAVAAMEAGADVVGTTLSGYTPYSRPGPDADWALLDELRVAGVPFVAEGRVNAPADAARAMTAGAAFVVVGSAITRPDVITGWFARAVQDAAGSQT